MKNTPIKICHETIYPGEHLSLALPLPEIFSCAPMYMPIKIIHGKQQGPCLLITAAMHGNELNGTEIINRLLSQKTLKNLRGTLITVPVLNVYGLINRSRYLPGGIELNRCFPGSKTGTHASRMANIFINEVFSMADACIDLQTGSINHTNLPQLYFHELDDRAKTLAESFNAPVISHFTEEEGSLHCYAFEKKIPFLKYEAGEAMRFDEHAIRVGLKGIQNVMKKLDMLSDRQKKEPSLKSFTTETNIWVCAETSGISHTIHQLGQHVKKGDTLSIIKDPFGAAENLAIKTPEEGIIVGMNNLPLVHEGEALFQLATFPKMKQAAEHLEAWEEKSNENFDNIQAE